MATSTDRSLVRLGQHPGGELMLDRDKLVESRTVLQGASAAGKSRTIRRLLELTLGRMQHIVLDVEDEFFTLREAGDYLILGGDEGDAPTSVNQAAAHARMILETGINAILLLNDLGLDGQRDYIGAFLEAMMRAPRSLWHPTLIVVDEAQRYAPQGEKTVPSYHGMVALAAQGRKRDFAGLFACQRLSMLSKDLLGNCQNRMIGRVDQNLDRDRGADTLGFGKKSEEALGLMTLPRGSFWCVGPALSASPVLARIDPSETTHLEPGQRNVPTPPAPEAVRAMLAKLQTAAPTSADGAGDVSAAAVPQVRIEYRTDPKAIAAARQAAWREGYNAAIDAGAASLAALRTNALDIVEAPAANPRVGATPPTPTPAPNASGAPAARAAKEERVVARPVAPSASDLGARQKVLDAIAWWEAVGITPIDRRRACITAGYSPKASTFGVYIADLARDGLVETQAPSLLVLTPAGRQSARFPAAGDRPDLPNMARGLLKDAEARVFIELINIYPDWIRRVDLADLLGYSRTASTLGVYLAAAGSFGFTETRPGQVRAASWLFGDAQ